MQFQTPRILDLPPFSSTPAASTASDHLLQLPPSGQIYDAIIIKIASSNGAFVAADIDEIKVTANGKNLVDVSGADLDALNLYQSLTKDAAYLAIHFADRNARTPEGQRFGALDTLNNPLQSLTLKVGVDGTQTGTTLTLEAFALLGGPKPAGTERMCRALLTANQSVGATRELLDVSIGARRFGNLVRSAGIFHSNLTHVEVRKDSDIIMANRAIADFDFLQDEVHRTPQSGLFVIDPMIDLVAGQAINPLRPDGNESALQFYGTFSSSDTIRIVSDLLVRDPSVV